MVTSVRTQPPVIMPGMQTEIKTQATNLAANLSAVRESATATLSGEIKGQQLEDFPALIKQASLDALFKCGKDAEALKEVFTNSNNVAGKKAIMEFAGLFRSALNATSDSPEAKTLLMKVGAEYTAQIIKDGLKEKSAFGPWLPETKKAEAKLENLEKQLLDIIKNNTGGELSKLSTNLVMQEVMPYIASCIEHNFGCTLDPLTRSSLTQLVDKAAAKAVEALDMCHQKLTQEQGTSVGREARHLEMQTLIPLLLRNVFAQIPADKLPDPKIPEPAAGPVPDGGKKQNLRVLISILILIAVTIAWITVSILTIAEAMSIIASAISIIATMIIAGRRLIIAEHLLITANAMASHTIRLTAAT